MDQARLSRQAVLPRRDAARRIAQWADIASNPYMLSRIMFCTLLQNPMTAKAYGPMVFRGLDVVSSWTRLLCDIISSAVVGKWSRGDGGRL